MEWLVSAYKSGLVPKGNLDLEDYQGFDDDQAHNLTASVFSDYSGDVGTVYDVPSSSTVVGDVSYIPTPGASGPAPNLANPDGIGIPAEAKNVERRRDVYKVVRPARQPGCFRRSQRRLTRLLAASPCRPTSPAWPTW